MLRSSWRLIAPHVDRWSARIAVLAALAIAAAALEAWLLVLIVHLALDAADVAANASDPGWISAGLDRPLLLGVPAAIGVMVLHWLVSRLAARLSTELLERLRHRLSASFLGSSTEVQGGLREGALSTLATNIAIQASLVANSVALASAAGASLFAVLIVATVIDAPTTLVVVAIGCVLFALTRPLTQRIQQRSRTALAADRALSEELALSSRIFGQVRAYGVEAAQLDRLDELNSAAARAHRDSRTIARFGSYAFRDLATITMLLTIVAFSDELGSEAADAGSVVFLILRCLGFASVLQSSLVQIRDQSPGLETLTSEIERLDRTPFPEGDVDVDGFESLEFRSVDFAYESTPVLDGLDLRVDRLETLGVVGGSGSGKSTLADLALRLIEPTAGTVLINGRSVSDYTARSLRSVTAHVPQEPVLLEGSIADNVRFMRTGIDDGEIERALDDVGLSEVVHGLPDGIHTPLGPRGVGLSGGQKQRVAIARALAGRAELVVLDEPTSALDADAEREIVAMLASLQGRMTMLIITHRPTPLEACTRVVEISDGRAKEHAR